MGAGHHHLLYLERDSGLHRLAPACKLAATALFVFAIVVTPREAFWAFGVYAIVVLGLARVAHLPWLTLARRLVIELPFLAFAVFLPFVGQGDRVDVVGVSLSVDGLWGTWNILAKGTLGVAATVVMVATTRVDDLLRGLERLRLPRLMTAIMGFMVRYGGILTDDARTMRIARESRGYDPRWIGHTRALAASAGTLFVRSYERGERVHLAMTARGYDGTMPRIIDAGPTTARAWLTALALPGCM